MNLFSRTAALLLAAVLSFSATPVSAADPAGNSVSVTVDHEAGVSPAAILSGVPGAVLTADYSLIDSFTAEIPADSLARLYAAEGVRQVTKTAVFTCTAAESTAEAAGTQTGSSVLQSDDPTAGSGTLIAVIDSGFDVTHEAFTLPDGAEKKITADSFAEAVTDTYAVYRETRDHVGALYISDKIPFVYDYAGRDGDVSATTAHGTHVAATAAGFGEVTGTAPGAQLALMKVFEDDGKSCSEASLLLAVEDAVLLGADVINLSLGTISYSSDTFTMQRLAAAIAAAAKKGITVVCAVGNDGMTGSGGTTSSLMSAGNPDYGLPSEPAVIPETLAVGALTNSIILAPYLQIGTEKYLYDDPHEVSAGQIRPIRDVLGGKSLSLEVVPGVGRAEDYADLSAEGKIVLVLRGEISFADKVRIAAEHGAVGVIIRNNEPDTDLLMSVTADAPIPAVSVSFRDGEALCALAGSEIVFSEADGIFPSESSITAASYSSRGPTSDLRLKPEIAAVGSYVYSAVPGNEYAAMSGTSMAAPQTAGMAAILIGRYRDRLEAIPTEQRSAAVKSYLMSAAQPLLTENGLPLSPRTQGAGMLTDLGHGLLLCAENGGAVTLGDELGDSFSMTVSLTNLSGAARTFRLHTTLITDGFTESDGQYYTTAAAVEVPMTVLPKNSSLLTLRAGETKTVTLTVTPDADFLAQNKTVFENGFYLEGYVSALDAEGNHAASIPFLGFCGDWEAAPLLDGGDWDGYVSYYGNQLLLRPMRSELFAAGLTAEGIFSSLFAFSPDADDRADRILFRVSPLRNIALCLITVTDENGQTVYENAGVNIPKSYADSGALLSSVLMLWDGSDGMNQHYACPDGIYRITLTLTGFTGGTQTLVIPLRIDTEKPVLRTCTLTDGVLYAEGEDNTALRSLRIYLPGEETGSYLVDTEILVPSADAVPVLSGECVLPEGLPYVYIRLEDQAGNVTITRFYLDT